MENLEKDLESLRKCVNCSSLDRIVTNDNEEESVLMYCHYHEKLIAPALTDAEECEAFLNQLKKYRTDQVLRDKLIMQGKINLKKIRMESRKKIEAENSQMVEMVQ